MRRESSTAVALVGEVGGGLLAGLARSANVSVARAPAADAAEAGQPGAARPEWEPGALAMREAAQRTSTYMICPMTRWLALPPDGGRFGMCPPDRAERRASRSAPRTRWRERRFD